MLFCIKDESTWINWQRSEFLLTASLAEQRTSSCEANWMPKLPVIHHRQNDSFEARSIWILNQLVCPAFYGNQCCFSDNVVFCHLFFLSSALFCSSESRFAARVGRLQKIVADIRVWGLWWESFEIKSAGLKGEGFVCCAEHGRHLNL